MNKKTKILIISHAFVVHKIDKRWRELAKDKHYEVHLLVPKYWESTWFKEKNIIRTEDYQQSNFYIHALKTSSVRYWTKYLFISFDAKLSKIKPDLIYIILGEEGFINQQILFYKKIFSPKSKVIFFSMNALGVSLLNPKNLLIKRVFYKCMWNNVKKNTDAAIVHYPGCVESLRNGGYKKPIFMQTQVGVDETLFSPNKNIRKIYRKKIGVEDKFVIGYVGRLTEDKGVDDLIAVFIELAKNYENIALLLVGNGNLRETIINNFIEANLEDRLHITNYVILEEVPKYINAMDTFVLGSKTLPHWIDTFPLVTVQAQAVGKPVIASDSASIPWQLADTAKIYKEGDRKQLKEALILFMKDEELCKYYATKGRERVHQLFCHKNMTKNFKKIIAQVLNKSFIYHKKDESYTQWKAVK